MELREIARDVYACLHPLQRGARVPRAARGAVRRADRCDRTLPRHVRAARVAAGGGVGSRLRRADEVARLVEADRGEGVADLLTGARARYGGDQGAARGRAELLGRDDGRAAGGVAAAAGMRRERVRGPRPGRGARPAEAPPGGAPATARVAR